MASLGGFAEIKNSGAQYKIVELGKISSTGAAVASLTSASIDRVPQGPTQDEHATFAICGQAQALVAGTVTLTIQLQHADLADAYSSSPGAFTAAPAAFQPSASVVYTATVATPVNVDYTFDVGVSGLKRFVRCVVTPVHSAAAGTNNIDAQLVAVVAGSHNVVERTVDFVPVG